MVERSPRPVLQAGPGAGVTGQKYEFAYPMRARRAQAAMSLDEPASLLRRPHVHLIRRDRELLLHASLVGDRDRRDVVLVEHLLELHEGQVALDNEVRVDAVVSVVVEPVGDSLGARVLVGGGPGGVEGVCSDPGVAGVEDCLFVCRVGGAPDDAEAWAALTAGWSTSLVHGSSHSP